MKRLKGIRNTVPDMCHKGVITTRGGLKYNVFDFNPKLFALDDIADSLSKINRYIGNIPNQSYSVAQHSVLGAQVFLFSGEVELAYQFLMHELTEAFLGDTLSPVKAIAPAFKKLEDEIEIKLYKHWGLPIKKDPRLKMLDLNLCEYEMTILLPGNAERNFQFDFWSPEVGKNRFIGMYNQIMKMREYKSKPLVTERNSHKLLDKYATKKK